MIKEIFNKLGLVKFIEINNKKEITEEIKKELDDYIIKYKRDLIR